MQLFGINKNDIQSYNDDNYGRNKEYFRSKPEMMKEMAKYAKENLARINKDLSEGKDIDSDFKRELEKFLAEYQKIEEETKKGVQETSKSLDVERVGDKKENEKYNFSTLQDLSDNLKSLEGLSANDVLIVNIKDSDSKLRLRDDNQEIIDRLNQGTEVVLTGNYKEIEGKVFVEVKNGDKKGWVALGYLRKEVAEAPKGNVNNVSVSPVKPTTTTDTDTTNINDVNNPHSIGTSRSYTETRGFGGLSAVGPERTISNSDIVDYNKEQQRLLDFNEKLNNPKINLLANILQVWNDAALKQAEKQWTLGGMIDDKEKIKSGVNDINDLFTIFLNKEEGSEENINELISNIFNIILRIEKDEEDIIDNIEEVKVLLDETDSKNLDINKIKVLRLMAGGMITDGNTAKVKEILARDILAENPKIYENILNIDNYENIAVATISNALGVKQSSELGIIAEELKKAWQEANASSQKQRKSYEKEILKHAPNLTGKDLSEAIDLAIRNGADLYCQSLFLEKATGFISKNNPGEKEKLYTSLDSFSQNASEWIGDNIGMIALSVIPMGAGFAAVGLAGKLGSIALRSEKIANLISGTGRIGTFGGNFVKGAIFYEGMNTTNNLLYLEKGDSWQNLFKNSGNISEIVKMGLTWNMFSLLNKMKIIPEGHTLSSIPKGTLAKNAIKVLSAEGAGFAGIDFAVENTIGEGRTWEEILEVFASGIIMSAAFRGVNYKRGESNNTNQKSGNERIIVGGESFRWSETHKVYIGKGGKRYSPEDFSKLQMEKAPRLENKSTEKGKTEKKAKGEGEIKQKTSEMLDKMSINDIFKNLKGKKGFEILKGIKDDSIKFGIERFIATRKSGLIGGLTGVSIEVFIDKSQNEEIDLKFWDLLKMFCIGAVGGLAISAVRSSGLATWGVMKKGGSLLKIGYDIAPIKKILIGSVVIGGISYYFYNTDK